MNWLGRLISWAESMLLATVGPSIYAARRSPHWPMARRLHLIRFPTCAACGNRKSVEVHHVKPFHEFPEDELDEANFLTLCEDGPGGMNCHLVIGHAGNWRLVNPNSRKDAARMLAMLTAARQAA